LASTKRIEAMHFYREPPRREAPNCCRVLLPNSCRFYESFP
jgi:hypothetical protein